MSKKAVPALLKEAFENASNSNRTPLTRVELLETFEFATSICVPANSQNLMVFNQNALAGLVQPSSLASPTASLQFASRVATQIPPLPAYLNKRGGLVTEYCRILAETRVLFLTGSIGMGKTTISKLIASDGDDWLWVHLADLEPEGVRESLFQLCQFLDINKEIRNVLLDDVDLTAQACKRYEHVFGGLLIIISERAGKVLVTSQQPPPSRLLTALNLKHRTVVDLPKLTQEEISGIIYSAGFDRSEQERSNLATILLFQTSGHPQLVQAAIRQLIEKNWPATSLDQFLETPNGVADEMRGARQLLKASFSDGERRFIYWLGVVGTFRREHAIAIGAKAGVDAPGDAFDSLLGPWIEQIDQNYFRVSPLIGSSARDVYDSDTMKEIHAGIAESVLKTKKLSQREASTVLFNAIAGKQGWIIVQCATNFVLELEDRLKKALYSELSWLLLLGLESGTKIYPELPFVNMSLRMLQYKVAAEIDPSKSQMIADRWNEETQQQDISDERLSQTQRFMYVSQILFSDGAQVSARRLVHCFREFDEIISGQSDIGAEFRNFNDSATNSKTEYWGSDAGSMLFGFASIHCNGPEFLINLINEIDLLPEELKARICDSPINLMSPSTNLVNKSWIAEGEKDAPDWESCISGLEAVQEKAKNIGLLGVAHAAARGRSILLDEMLKDHDGARIVVEEALIKLGPSALLEDQMATLLLNRKDYGNALKKWLELGSGVRSAEIDDWTVRKTAIAAAGTGNWSLAAEIFEGVSKRDRDPEMAWLTIALCADAAHAHWKSGNHPAMFSGLQSALKGLENLPQETSDYRRHALSKCVGNILLWISNQTSRNPNELIAENFPGMCSNPDEIELLKSLPETEIELCWVTLASVELQLQLGTEVSELVTARFDNHDGASLGVILRRVQLLLAIRLKSFDEIIKRAFQQTRLLTFLKTQPLDEQIVIKRYEDWIFERPINATESEVIFPIMLVSLATLNSARDRESALQIWREYCRNDDRYNIILGYVDMIEKIMRSGVKGAQDLLHGKDNGWFVQSTAALVITLGGCYSPEDVFQSHVFLLGTFEYTLVGDALPNLSTLVEQKWLEFCGRPFLLRDPGKNVPAILSACNQPLDGIAKVAAILIAAAPAMSSPVSGEYIDQLQGKLQ